MTWMPSTRRAPPWIRLWLAALVVAVCTLTGLRKRCDELNDLLLDSLMMGAAVQLASAIGSFVMIVVACARRDFGRAGVEALVCVAMLLAVPLAVFALVSSMPDCSEPPRGG